MSGLAAPEIRWRDPRYGCLFTACGQHEDDRALLLHGFIERVHDRPVVPQLDFTARMLGSISGGIIEYHPTTHRISPARSGISRVQKDWMPNAAVALFRMLTFAELEDIIESPIFMRLFA